VSIAYARIEAVARTYRRLRQVARTDEVVSALRAQHRDTFSYMRDGRSRLASPEVMRAWLLHARFWGLVEQDLLSLTQAGRDATAAQAAFPRQLYITMSHVCQERFQIELDHLKHAVASLTRAAAPDRPTLDNWQTQVAETVENGDRMPAARFRQCAALLVGMQYVRRDVVALYYEI
jgi:hypothetical protein